jgi:signal transduction histidine kinase
VGLKISLKLLERKNKVAYIAFFLLFGSVAGRAFFNYHGYKLQYVVNTLLLIFLALSISPQFIAPKIKLYPYAYLVIQSALISTLLILPPTYDYFSILYVCLTIQAMTYFSIKKGFLWVAIFSLLLLAALLYSQGVKGGILFFPVPLAGCILTALYIMAARKADEEKNRSQALLGELQSAYKKLEEYTKQAEEFAVAGERNRLARELHDSVTQKLFSMTLTAEAARMIHEKKSERIEPLLERIQELARDSLTEMRALLKKLRPKTITKDGLVPALKQHIKERQDKDGFNVNLTVEGDASLPAGIEEALFRIIQEALNNVVKHSGVDSANIALRFREDALSICIEDQGRGFHVSKLDKGSSHLGLSSMNERAKLLGGTFTIESEPGYGTRIYVEVPRVLEV